MIFCAGIDGGQTSTKAVIVDAAGSVIGRGSAGGLDHIGIPGALEGLRAAVRAALDAARVDAGLDPKSPIAVAVAGLTGFGGAENAVGEVIAAGRVRVTHDAPIALAGALDLAPGIVVIAGTGSVVYAEDGLGKSLQLGGWGYLFGDVGSAFWIARRALELAIRAHDLNEPQHRLGLAALSYFDVPTLQVLARNYYQRRITRERFAGFARLVSDAARFGEPDAIEIFEECARQLATLCAAATRRLALEHVRIAPVGGVFASPELRTRFMRSVGGLVPGAEVVEPIHDAAVGAALLALREAKRTRRPDTPT